MFFRVPELVLPRSSCQIEFVMYRSHEDPKTGAQHCGGVKKTMWLFLPSRALTIGGREHSHTKRTLRPARLTAVLDSRSFPHSASSDARLGRGLCTLWVRVVQLVCLLQIEGICCSTGPKHGRTFKVGTYFVNLWRSKKHTHT